MVPSAASAGSVAPIVSRSFGTAPSASSSIGITGPDRRWGLELWANNLFDVDYTQVAFNTPFVAPQQTYSAFLAEPRTYGITVRAGF